MKHTHTIQRARAYTARPISHERQIEIQREAASLAVQRGDMDEYTRCSSRANLLSQRRTQPERVIELPGWIVRGALGKRDSIVRMFEAGQLNLHQVSAAMDLRAYAQGDAVAAAGLSGGFSDFVDGGSLSGMEAHVDRMRPGREAKERMRDNLEPDVFRAAWKVIVYGASLRDGCKVFRCDTTKAMRQFRETIQDSLTEAAGYFGARAQEAA